MPTTNLATRGTVSEEDELEYNSDASEDEPEEEISGEAAEIVNVL